MKIYQIAAPVLFLLACAAQAQSAPANLAACEAKLNQAQKLDLLKDLKIKGTGIVVSVGPTWYGIDFGAKEGFAKVVSCAVVRGDSSRCAHDVTYVDWKSGKPVAKYKNCKLVPT